MLGSPDQTWPQSWGSQPRMMSFLQSSGIFVGVANVIVMVISVVSVIAIVIVILILIVILIVIVIIELENYYW